MPRELGPEDERRACKEEIWEVPPRTREAYEKQQLNEGIGDCGGQLKKSTLCKHEGYKCISWVRQRPEKKDDKMKVLPVIFVKTSRIKN